VSLAVVLVALVAANAGCVYYNTFYHARTAYDEAERIWMTRPPDSEPTPQELDLLDRVIEKSGRVVKLYPESSWADDALLLLAQALYRQGKYESAEMRLTDFLALHPESELRPQAEYTLAAVMLERGNPVSAEQTLEALAYADVPGELSDDAMILIGRAKNARRHFDEAAEVYMSALERFPRSNLRAELRLLAAENYVTMGRLEDAAHHLRAVAEESGARQLAFEARIKLADVYLDLNELDAALNVLDDLERRTVDRNDLDRVLLLRGKTYEAQEDYDESVSTYDGVAASHARSEAAAEARYRIGVIRRDRFGRFDEAIEAFREARDESPRSDVAKLAAKAIKDVESLQGYLLTITEWNEAQTAGETLVPEAADADTLLTVVVGADTLLSEATDADTLLTVVVGADTLLSEAADADTLLTSEEIPVEDEEIVSDLALARFRVAELYLFKLDNPQLAIEYYTDVVSRHGESALGPKAALAIAYVRESVLNQSVLASGAYRDVIELYPGTEYATEAEKALAALVEREPILQQ
jgi:TolA-binding protein